MSTTDTATTGQDYSDSTLTLSASYSEDITRPELILEGKKYGAREGTKKEKKASPGAYLILS